MALLSASLSAASVYKDADPLADSGAMVEPRRVLLIPKKGVFDSQPFFFISIGRDELLGFAYMYVIEQRCHNDKEQVR